MPDETSPLMVLSHKLLSCGLPSLNCLRAQISDAEGFADFIQLVKTYLPEREREILHERTPGTQVAKFASYFEDRYFPLEEYFKFGETETYEEIARRMPLMVMGLNDEDYHEMSEARPGAAIMTYLITNPYYDEEESLVSLAEACREHIPDALVQRAEHCQLSPEEAASFLAGTKYEPLAMWADRLHLGTGNFFLDTDYEMLVNSIPPDWDPENVRELTRQWKQAELHDEKTGDFMEWLEQDLPGHLEELVAFIERKKEHAEDS